MGAQVSYSVDDVPAQRFFISYRRSAEIDRFLANYLKTRLEEAGHEVFIDTDLQAGMDWGAEINRRIVDWCDYLVVVLSEQSITSKMVKGEVRKAHQAQQANGRPVILPIRVGDDDAFDVDYELDSYLGSIQYIFWNGEDDAEHVLNDLTEAVSPCGLYEAPNQSFRPAMVEPDLEQSDFGADRSAMLRPPGCACKIGDPFYIERGPDSTLQQLSGSEGETIVIKAPQKMGKSSLLVRYLESCRDIGKRIVYLDFQSLTKTDLECYEYLLRRIAAQILRSLKLDAPDVASIGSQQEFVFFIEDNVLNAVEEPITFGFDEVDQLLSHPYKIDFFSMLRTWHNNGADPFSRWSDVDMALVITTEPHLLIKSGDRSPFNVGVPIELKPFGRTALDRLNELYGSPLRAEQLCKLHDLLAGHPYLTRLAFYRQLEWSMTFSELIQHAGHSDGPFGDHLRDMLRMLRHQPDLLASFTKLISDHRWQPDVQTYYYLHSAGLACRRHGRIEPANRLYADFFAEVQ